MTKKRMINCDFLNASGFLSNLSNKAKLLYFMFITNADDEGFVGNALDLANSLDNCEQNFENTLFSYTYKQAIEELVDKRLVFEFSDKANNKVYLVRHWFMHQQTLQKRFTNYISYLSKVELENGKYQLKTIERERIIGKEKKGNEMKGTQISNISNKDFNDSDTIVEKENKTQEKDWEQDWDKILKEMENNG